MAREKDVGVASSSNPRSSSSLGVQMAAWSSVDDDLLFSIFSELSIPDLIRSTAVCSTWSAAIGESIGRNRLQSLHRPCLVALENVASFVEVFFSISDSTPFVIPLPDPPSCGRHRVVGSSYGWLIVVDQLRNLRLLNPLSRKQIDLPSVTTMDCIEPIGDPRGRIIRYRSCYHGFPISYGITSWEMSMLFYSRALLSSDPSQGDDYTVAVIHEPLHIISFARAGDSSWTPLPGQGSYGHAAFHKDRLYAVRCNRVAVDVWDLAAPRSPAAKVVALQPMYPPRGCCILDNLVESPSGELLLISWSINNTGYASQDSHRIVKVFKIDTGGGGLLEVNDLGDYAIFAGMTCPVYLPCAGFPELRSNAIYFTDDSLNVNHYSRYHPKKLVSIYDLKNNRFSRILSSNTRQVEGDWSSHIWLQPNLR